MANKKVFLKTYLKARHELLNETNKDEVYNDVGSFIIENTIENIKIK